jgi:uncharacterized protein YjiS (DUF1127 family)
MQSLKRALVSLRQAFQLLAVELRYRSAIRKLHAFGRRELADIGIAGGEIEYAVRHGRSRLSGGDEQTASEARAVTIEHDQASAASALLLNALGKGEVLQRRLPAERPSSPLVEATSKAA